MNADEMLYELGFEKVNECSNEISVMYYCLTENDHWIVRFFKSYGIVNYLVSHTHWFETDREWKKNGSGYRHGPAQSNSSGFA